MIPIIYESTETEFTTNGLGRLRDCISAVCVEERNGVYQTDIEYPVGGANYDLIQIGRIVGVTHDETGTVEPFDIVSMERPINGVVTVHCVHISYRLTGITTWAKNINSLAAALDVFNNISGNPFTFSADFTSGAYMAAFDGVPRTVRQLMGGVEGSILDAYGGEWEFTRYNAILHKSRGQMRDFAIRYGVNMLDYDESIDYEGAYNSCVPFWTGTDDKGASVVVRGSRVDSGQLLPNGRRVVVPLDLTEKFEEKPTAAQLQTMAASVMNARRPYLPAQNIKVDFIRLQDFAGYEDFAALLQCNLCDTINVVFPAYETQAPFKIVKTTWDILDGKYTEMELGQLSATLSEALGITGGGTFTETAGGTVTDVMVNGASVVDSDGIAMVTDTDGNLKLNGTITAGDHNSPIGTVKDGTRVSGAGSVGTSYSDVATVALSKGTWHVDAFNSFNGGTAGKRSILLTTTAGATYDAAEGSGSAYANANTQIVVRSSLTVYVTASAGVTVHLRAKSSAQVDSPYGNITAVRIA